MNGTETRSDEIARYLDGVATALLDLPADVRDELLEDLPAHLAEVASEDSGPLEARLGSPERYAAELRAAAGLAPGGTSRGAPRLAGLLGRSAEMARQADVRAGRLIGYPRFTEYLRLLRPAWWVLRGYVLDVIVFGLPNGMQSIIPLVGGGHLLTGTALLLACVLASIGFGRQAGRWRRTWQRRGLSTLNLVMAVLALVVAFQVSDDIRDAWQAGNPSASQTDQDGGVLDVIPVGPDGKPLSGVRLFDQNGNELDIGDPYSCPSAPAVEYQYQYPMCGNPQALYGVPAWWPSAQSIVPSSIVPSPAATMPVSAPASAPASAPVSAPVSPSAAVPSRGVAPESSPSAVATASPGG